MPMLRKIIFTVLALLMLAGCGEASYSMTGSPNRTKIEVNAKDGKYGEGFVMDIGKNEMIVIESQLENGSLQIDFAEVYNTATADESANYEFINTIESVTIKPGDRIELKLDYTGDFMTFFTSVGKTNGTLTISIIKQ